MAKQNLLSFLFLSVSPPFSENVPKLHPLFLLAWTAATTLPLAGQTSTDANATKQPKLSSDNDIVLDEGTGQLVAKGMARMEYGNLLLLADEIRYARETGQASAKGSVILTFEEFRILADELEYTLKNEAFSAKNARFGRYPLVGVSESLEGSLSGLSTARNATVYLLKPNGLEPNFRAGTLIYDAKAGGFQAEKVRFRVGETTLLGLPHIKAKQREKAFELRLSADHADHLGTSVEVGALFSVHPNLKLGGFVEGFSKRGLLAGPEAKYGFDDDSVRGSFSSGFIEDEDPLGLDVQGSLLSDSRGFIDWSHRQRFNENLSLATQVQWHSDSEVLRDFREEIFHGRQWNDTFAELTYSKGNAMASLFARAQPNDFADQIERKPEIGLHYLPTELLDTGIYHSLSVELAELEERKGDGLDEIESDRMGLNYHLVRHFHVARWFSITPSATYRMAHYGDALPPDASLTRHFGEFGLDARVPFHATFDVRNQLWDVDGLRHVGSFLFQYRYLDDSSDGDRDRVPSLDRRYFDPNLRPLDLREVRYLDDLQERNLLRVGIENRIQTRAKDYGSRDLAALRVYQDFLVDPDPGDESLDEFYGEVELRPAPWLALGLQAKMDTEEGDLRQVALETRLLDAGDSELSFSILRMENPAREEDRTKQYRLLGFRRLDEQRAIQTGLQFDARTGDLTRANLGLFSRVSDSWDVVYMLSHRKGTDREDDLAFRISIRILAF